LTDSGHIDPVTDKDHVDRLVDRWKQEKPEYNLAPVEVIGRAARIMEHVDRALESKFEEWGITRASFDVLATLRRAGQPYRLLQRELMRQLMRTSGSISLRIDALERDGLVKRELNEEDRRTSEVVLTTAGHKLLEKVIPEHLANESALVAGLTVRERSELVALLRKWLLSLEADVSQENHVQLGLVLLNPRASMMKRRAAGLPDASGLLIHSVEKDSLSARAGLRRGDLITQVEDLSIASLSAMRRATSRQQPRWKRFLVLRGAEPVTVKVDCRDEE
jgi:DNA-binding MarR family transcriptional regulator